MNFSIKSISNILGKLEALLKLLYATVYFYTDDNLSKTIKNLFISSKKLFFLRDIQIAIIFSLSFCTSQIQ